MTRVGTVTTFDEQRGLGEVSDDGGASYPFHCTALRDGSRRVAVGTAVAFELAAGHVGRMEARSLQPLR
ncbi:MAG TPA: hypothetical protein VMV14_01775 [Acidimicrobiales bacterium]|nr:hypothetical protein [Acidimicrobiales bacterium]